MVKRVYAIIYVYYVFFVSNGCVCFCQKRRDRRFCNGVWL